MTAKEPTPAPLQQQDHARLSPTNEQELVGVCISLAEQLLTTAKDEASALKKFEVRPLLELLPGKEHLVNKLRDAITSLKELTRCNSGLKSEAKFLLLGDILQQIAEVNHSNHIFIEGTLSYYADFLDQFAPFNYGFRQGGQFKQDRRFCKGLTFKKEI